MKVHETLKFEHFSKKKNRNNLMHHKNTARENVYIW